MGTFPPAVTQQGPSAAPSTGGASPVIKLTMLGQLIRGLATEFPQAQEGIQMMMQGLQKVQASASAGSTPQQPPAPPR
jgi:hypothetical protein